MKTVLKRVWSGWKKGAHAFARFQTKLLIGIFYFLVISPIGLIMRLFGWDPLDRKKFRGDSQSNWKPIDNDRDDISSLGRMS